MRVGSAVLLLLLHVCRVLIDPSYVKNAKGDTEIAIVCTAADSSGRTCLAATAAAVAAAGVVVAV